MSGGSAILTRWLWPVLYGNAEAEIAVSEVRRVGISGTGPFLLACREAVPQARNLEYAARAAQVAAAALSPPLNCDIGAALHFLAGATLFNLSAAVRMAERSEAKPAAHFAVHPFKNRFIPVHVNIFPYLTHVRRVIISGEYFVFASPMTSTSKPSIFQTLETAPNPTLLTEAGGEPKTASASDTGIPSHNRFTFSTVTPGVGINSRTPTSPAPAKKTNKPDHSSTRLRFDMVCPWRPVRATRPFSRPRRTWGNRPTRGAVGAVQRAEAVGIVHGRFLVRSDDLTLSAFKVNTTGGIGGLLAKAYHLFCLNSGITCATIIKGRTRNPSSQP